MGIRVFAAGHVQSNLDQAERILVRHETEGLLKLGNDLRDSLRPRMRKFTGEGQRRIKVAVVGRRLNKSVEIFGELVQHYVDEYGLPPGIFPPWDVGTLIYKYAEKKGQAPEPDPTVPRQRVGRNRRRVSHVRSRRPAADRQRVAAIRAREQGAGAKVTRAKTRHKAAKAETQKPGRTARVIKKERAVRRVAFLIARGIFESGIKANAPFARTLDANRAKIVRDMQGIINRAVAEINRG